MAARLNPKETAWLYGVIFSCSLVFFLLGVFVGKRYFAGVQEVVEALPGESSSVEDVKPQLDFYEELMTPAGDAQTAEDTAEPPHVTITVPAEDPSGPSPDRPQERAADSTFYTVQVAALKSADDAQRVVLRLETKGYSARIVQPQPDDNEYYRVWVGEAETRELASQLESQLKQDRFHTFVKKVQRPN